MNNQPQPGFTVRRFLGGTKFWRLILCLAFGIALDVGAQTNLPVRPAKFSFWSGGMGGHISVEWNGKALVYEATEDSSVVTNRTVHPTDKQWRQFWAATDKMKLSQWQRLYENPNIMDGWVWTIEITRGAQKINTHGRNAVPDDADVTKTSKEPLPNKTFNGFKSALEDLLGFKMR